MTEPEVIYQYLQHTMAAERLGLSLTSTRYEFVLRKKKDQQEWGRCSNLGEVEEAIEAWSVATTGYPLPRAD